MRYPVGYGVNGLSMTNEQNEHVYAEQIRIIAEQVMDIDEVRHTTITRAAAIELVGHLRFDPTTTYTYAQTHFDPLGYTPMLRQDARDGRVILVAVRGMFRPPHVPHRRWLPLLLFLLTVGSTVLVGGQTSQGFHLATGAAFSLAILSILLSHEMGHFLMARRLGVSVSYPFFLPMPFSPIGTMGAVIAMRSPPANRRDLLAIALAGPIAGLVMAIPVLLLGLWLSPVIQHVDGPWRPATTLDLLPFLFDTVSESPFRGIIEGNSLLYTMLKIMVFGRMLPDGQEDVLLHPIAFAGWFGILVTALNLTPAGQLDGGHILYALVGAPIAALVTRIVGIALFLLGFLWMGWFLWAVLIMIFGQHRAPLLNEVTPLGERERLIAIGGLVLFALVFTPIPLTMILPL